MPEDTVTIKYESSSAEITERQISGIVSKISCGKIFISAYCHLRNEPRSFMLDNILEARINGNTVDRDLFYIQNIQDNKKFLKEADKIIVKMQDELNAFLELRERVKSL